MQITPGFGLSLGAAGISFLAIVFARRHWEVAGMPALVGFNAAVVIWTIGNAAQLSVTSLPAKLFWINFQYIGIAALPITVFAFAASIAGYTQWITRTRMAVLGAPLVAMVGLSWTNRSHHLIRETATLGTVNGTVVVERTFGPVFWGTWAYSNLLLFLATLLILRAVISADVFVKRRTAALLIGAAVPWIAHLLYLTGVSPYEAEPFFGITGLSFVYAMIRYQQVDYVPPRRDRVLEEVKEGILTVSEANHLLDLNSAARRMLDLDGEAAIGKPIEYVLDDHPELLDVFLGDESEGLVSIQTESGTQHLSVDTTRIENELGGSSAVVVLNDVTELKNRGEKLERQRDRLEEFASVVSHDLRNPLNVAEGRLQLAKDEYESEHLEKVAQSHDRMQALVDDLLSLARQGDSVETTERVGLSDVTVESWKNVETKRATISIECNRTIVADRDRLQQLLENLFRDAVEHGGEAVTVTVGDLDDGFYVADDGPGIPEAEREKVFESGYSTIEQNTGLGLSIVREIVEAHEWEIEVTESETAGACFEIRGVESVTE